jgi:serine protease AprX
LTASYSSIHLGYQWLLDPDGNPNTNDTPDVINNSWGFRNNVNECISEFQADIQALKAAEIAVVFSAGNEGPYTATSISPANYPESFAVGAVDDTLAIANFSSRGPSACDGSIYPEVVAPGVNIKTSDLSFGGVFPYSDAYVSGTSFAAPHLAGAMALLLNAYPQTTVSALEMTLTDSALDMGLNGPDDDYGNGLVDVFEAYLLLGQNSPQCTDADGDGYFVEAECGTALDCNDTYDTIYPSAPEEKHDGIDQDCNGYDLTIDIFKAAYTAKRDTLTVEAVSALGKNAALELLGYGPMKWHRKNNKWTISIKGVGGDPLTVTVSGVEGSETAQTTSK